MAGQERRIGKPNSTRASLPHAATADQENFTCAEIQGRRRACDNQVIGEDDAAPNLSSLQPSEQRKKQQQP
jgi:hypothetical protein